MNNTKLFDFIYNSVVDEGGDGDCVVILTASKYQGVAVEFEKWLIEQNITGWSMKHGYDTVNFWRDQESITFTNTTEGWAPWSSKQLGVRRYTQMVYTPGWNT